MESKAPEVTGSVVVRPVFKDEQRDPYSIFASPDVAKAKLSLEEDGSINLDNNMVVNLGRQTLAYLIGGKDHGTFNWNVTGISWGTFDEAPRFGDTTLSPQPSGDFVGGENEILYDGVSKKKSLVSIDFPSPFLVRFEALLTEDEGNGYALREMGLWTGNGSLFARKVMVPVAKSSEFALSFIWTIRF